MSAGFDAHHADPLLQLNLTTNAFYETGVLLSKNFPDAFACLEGGYNLDYLHRCVLDFVNGMNGKKQQFSEDMSKSDVTCTNDYKLRIELLKENLRGVWRV